MLLPMFARVLRLVSIAISLLAVAWLVAFAVDQSSSASYHQQAEVNAAGPPGLTPAPTAPGKESALHEAVDEAFSTFSSPFTGVTGSSSQWVNHIVEALLVLLVYGFGLGFLARIMRMAG